MSGTEHYRADCHETDASTPIPERYIRRAAPDSIASTLLQGARNGVAEWIAEDADALVRDGVRYAGDDIVIIGGQYEWVTIRSDVDADPDAIEAVRSAHDSVARDHNIDPSHTDMLVIDRSLISDDIDIEE